MGYSADQPWRGSSSVARRLAEAVALLLALLILGQGRLRLRLLGRLLRGDPLLRFLLLLLGGLVLFVAGPLRARSEQCRHGRADPDQLLHRGPRPAGVAGSPEASAAATRWLRPPVRWDGRSANGR